MMLEKFEELRPFNDEEFKQGMQRMINEPLFYSASKFIFPELSNQDIREKASKVKTISEFQEDFMYAALKKIVIDSTDGFSYSGFENLEKGKPYLFIANHRDIFLDPSFLEIVFVEKKYPTSQITFGSNLLSSRFLLDLSKSNKMCSVLREGSIQEIYQSSVMLSEYIRYTITEKEESIWLAQRNGRTKDGNDVTQPGLLKMLNISGKVDFEKDFKKLNIVPVSISYEFEPCVSQKVNELFISKHGEYVKAPDEDMKSIISGITENKGKVHLAIGKPIVDEIEYIENITNKNEKINSLAIEIDKQIHSNYHLFKNNYIAADIYNNNKDYKYKYLREEKEMFVEYMNGKLKGLNGDYDQLKSLFLGIYAYPVVNKYKYL